MCLCLKNGVINLLGIATPLVMFYFVQMANLGKCADLAQEMLLQLLLQLLVPMTLHFEKWKVNLAILTDFVGFTVFFQFVHLCRGKWESL
jgi:hypothetical protein